MAAKDEVPTPASGGQSRTTAGAEADLTDGGAQSRLPAQRPTELTPDTEAATDSQKRASRKWVGEFGAIWVATALLFAVSPLVARGSLTSSAILSMLPFAAVLAMAAIGQTLVVMQRGLDLSVPGVISLSALLVSDFGSSHGLVSAVLLVLLVGGGIGLVNALVITVLRVTPFVATLGINAVLAGVVLAYSGGKSDSAPRSLTDFALAKTFGVPNTALLATILAVVVSVVLGKSVVGRRFRLAGANPHAARVAGIRVNLHHAGAYVACSICAAIAGVLLAGFLKTPSLQIGDAYLLASIAAVVLGGTSLAGGRGSAAATVAGALFLSQLDQVTRAMGAVTSTQFLVQGAIIGAGMSLRSIPWAGMRSRLSRVQPTPR